MWQGPLLSHELNGCVPFALLQLYEYAAYYGIQMCRKSFDIITGYSHDGMNMVSGIWG